METVDGTAGTTAGGAAGEGRAPLGMDLEQKVETTARSLFSLMDQSKSSPLSQERWQSEMMDWAMADERLKVELFRFVDVFPTLRLARPRSTVTCASTSTSPGSQPPRAARRPASARRGGARRLTAGRRPSSAARCCAFAQRFIVGRDARDAARRAARPAAQAAWASPSTCSARPP